MTLVNVMHFPHFFFPSFVIWRKEHVGFLRGVVYLGNGKPVGYIHSLGIYASSTYYIYIVVIDAILTAFF